GELAGRNGRGIHVDDGVDLAVLPGGGVLRGASGAGQELDVPALIAEDDCVVLVMVRVGHGILLRRRPLADACATGQGPAESVVCWSLTSRSSCHRLPVTWGSAPARAAPQGCCRGRSNALGCLPDRSSITRRPESRTVAQPARLRARECWLRARECSARAQTRFAWRGHRHRVRWCRTFSASISSWSTGRSRSLFPTGPTIAIRICSASPRP